MATRQKLTKEFLTCIICHEVFKDPVTLHCGHTFCMKCITSYTETQKRAIVAKSIPCPHCRGLTTVPDPNKPVDEWAGQFHTGFFVRGLIDAVVTDEKDCDDCASCLEDGENIPAVFWCKGCGHGLCSGCEKFHRKMPFSKNHEVVHLTEDNRHSVKKVSQLFTCSKHPDSVTDMMCEDHDVAMCHRCCVLYHRKCESVVTLDECLPRLKSVIEAHSKELEAAEMEIKQGLSLKTSAVAKVEKEAEEAVKTIDVSCEKIIDAVRKQETQLKENVKQTTNKALQYLQGDIKTDKMRLEETQQKLWLIREAREADVAMNYYELYKLGNPSALTDNEDSTSSQLMMQIEVSDNSDEIISYIGDKAVAFFKLTENSLHTTGSVSDPENNAAHVGSLSTFYLPSAGSQSKSSLPPDDPLSISDSQSDVCPSNSLSPPEGSQSSYYSPETTSLSRSISSPPVTPSRSKLPADGTRSRSNTPPGGSQSRAKSPPAGSPAKSKSTLFGKIESGLKSLSDGYRH